MEEGTGLGFGYLNLKNIIGIRLKDLHNQLHKLNNHKRPSE